MSLLRFTVTIFWSALLLTGLIGCGRATPLNVKRPAIDDIFNGGPEPVPSPSPTVFPTPIPFPTLAPVPPTPPGPVPQPPSAGPLGCRLEKQGPVLEDDEPMIVTLFGSGPVIAASINGIPVGSGERLAVHPLMNGSYLANGIVIGAGGLTSSCQLIFVPPRCSLSLLEQSAQQVRVEMALEGAVAEASINGQRLTLSPQNRVQFGITATAPGIVEGRVRGPGGDEGRCSVDYTLPITTTSGAVTPYYFTDGFNTDGPSSFVMGGGVKSTYGVWSAIPGNSSLPIHIGNNLQRTNDCGVKEIVVGFSSSNITAPWAQTICSTLIPGLELYDPRVIYVAWSAELNDRCSNGEVLTGTAWEAGKNYGQWGGRLVLKCSKIRWEE